MNRESLTSELKRVYTDDIKKTIIAFANTKGGEILIGVADDGEVIGLVDAAAAMLQVTNAARDAIKPDVTLFMSCETREMEGKQIIAVSVQKGTASPYYLSGKGIRPEGVFIRQGASTVPATESAILKMIRETGGDDFETTRSLRQDLTFEETGRFFAEEKTKFGKEQKKSLGIIGADESFTNLGLLLSDQCSHSAKLAVFEGSSKTVFKDRAEFTGSLLKQLEDIYAYIDRFNRTRAEVSGLRRVDMRDYPQGAVREALLNAIVHRDYSYSGSTLISIFENRIEFVSLGGLSKGITYNDIMLGVSVLRNKHLAEICYRLHLIEAYGTGMLKIMESYSDSQVQPSVEVSDNAFKITLPNTNIHPELPDKADTLSVKEQAILVYLSKHGPSARAQIEAGLVLSQSAAIRTIKKLLDQGLIKSSGKGKNIRYSNS